MTILSFVLSGFPGLDSIAVFLLPAAVVAVVEIRRSVQALRDRDDGDTALVARRLIIILILPFAIGGAGMLAREGVMLWYGRDLVNAAYRSAEIKAAGKPYCVRDRYTATRFEDLDKRRLLKRAVEERLEHPRPDGRVNTSPHFGIQVGNKSYWWSFRERKFLRYRPGVWWHLPPPNCPPA